MPDEAIVDVVDAIDLRDRPYRLLQKAGWADLARDLWFVVALAARPWRAPALIHRDHARWMVLALAVFLVFVFFAGLRHIYFAGAGVSMLLTIVLYGAIPLKTCPRYGLASMGVSIFVDALISLSYVFLLPRFDPGSMPRVGIFEIELLMCGFIGLALLCGVGSPNDADGNDGADSRHRG